MKIAYYEENNYHTEILGTFIEPFVSDEITVYNDSDKSDYINWYKKKINFNTEKICNFPNDYLKYDLIIIGTSSSFKYYDKINEFYNNYNEKRPFIFFINHLKEDAIKYGNLNGFVLTPLNIVNNLNYILPVNNLYKNKNKNYNKLITICLIGRFKDSNRDHNDLIKLINDYNHLNFKIIIYTRHKKFIPDNILDIQKLYKNKITINYKSSTETIINSLENIMYFCPLSSNSSCYTKDRLTGMIPFSLNFNTPLLLDEETNLYYKLKSPIIYKKSLCEIIENICNKEKDEYENLISNTIEEKEKICSENLNKFNDLFNKNL